MIASPSRATGPAGARRARAASTRDRSAAPRSSAARARRRSNRWAATRRGSAGSPAATPVVAAIEAAAQRTHGCVRVEARRRHRLGSRPARTSTFANPRMIEMRANGRNEPAPVAAGDEANLQVSARARRNRVDRTVGIARAKREHFERVPAEDALGRRQIRLAPVGVDRGPVRLAGLDVGERAPDRMRDRRRKQPGDEDAAARIDHRRDRVREHDPGLASSPPQLPE